MRTILLGDLHLVRGTPRDVTDDLASLLDRHPGDRVVFAGDLFDLSSDRETAKAGGVREQVVAALAAHPNAKAALARHLEHGELWLLSGNHDAIVGEPEFAPAFLDAIGATGEARARLRTSPWFMRDGDLHIEHGHVFDPDNAPAHPLVNGAASLGVHFVEEFIAPTGAHRYLQANDETPLYLLAHAFRWYGPRAPYVIYRYFHAAIAAMARSGPFYRARDEAAVGASRVASFAEAHDAPASMIDELVGNVSRSTMESLVETFQRLYFDRVLATIAMSAGLATFAIGKRRNGAILFGLGAAAMGASWAAGHNRYAGSVPEQLARGAAKIREVTAAKLVVFGHTHQEEISDGYANTGSFAFPKSAPGRPYLIFDRGRVERAYFTR